MLIETEKDHFISYLEHRVKNGAPQYKASTISAYANSLDLITQDLKSNLNLSITSLYDIIEVATLEAYFNALFRLPHIVESERIQRKRKTNGFKRYIEFRDFEQNIGDESNEPILADIQEARTEGGERVVISKFAERDNSLRKRAIEIHGLTCKGCGFNFFDRYGEIGKRFIEIHHIKPLKTGDVFVEVLTNPFTDLIPLCSNCHRMVHVRRNKVLTIEELKATLKYN